MCGVRTAPRIGGSAMSSATSVGTAHHDTRVPWTDVLLSAIAAVSWALIGMAGTAALGLHLLGADATGSLGPMTAAVVALGAGGSVTPTGDVSAFGLTGAQANTAVTITPLGVSLVGALLLSYFFLRSLRAAGVVIAPAELLARAGSVIALFVAMLGGLAWAGHDVITIDGSKLGLDKLTGGGSGGGGVNIPGLGDIGDIGGLLPDKVGDLVKAKAAVGFTVDTAPTLLGGLAWSAGILLIALLASRRTPLPRGWEAVHRVVRPAASALVTVLLVAVAAGLAAAAYAAIGDDHPKRIAGAALLGAPNGVWLGIPLGLFVPWDGEATGELSKLLPHPLDHLLSAKSNQPVTVGRLAELDGRVWLLAVAAALMMLLAGVLAAARTPVGVRGVGGSAGSTGAGVPGVARGLGDASGASAPGAVGGLGDARGTSAPGVVGGRGDASGSGGRNGRESALGFAGRCALRLGVVTALTLPLLAWLTDVSVDASLSVLGFDAFGAGIELHGHLGMALVLGAVWGAGAGGVGGLLAYATGAAGWRASRLARGDLGTGSGTGTGVGEGVVVGVGVGSGVGSGSGAGSDGWRPGSGVGSGSGAGSDGWGPGYPERSQPVGSAGHGGGAGPARGPGSAKGSGTAGDSGPYVPSEPYRAPNPATNPYLQVPDELRQPEDRRPSGGAWPDGKQSGRGGGAGPRGSGAGGSGAGGEWGGGGGPGGAGGGGAGSGDAGAGGSGPRGGGTGGAGPGSGGPRGVGPGGGAPGGAGPGGGGPRGGAPGGGGPGGGDRPRGAAWPPGAGSPTEVVWPPSAGSPQDGGRPPGGGARGDGAGQPPGDVGPSGGARSRGPAWPRDAGSPQEGAWPPGEGTPQQGGRPPLGGAAPAGRPQPPGSAGQFGAGGAPGAVGPGGVGPYAGSTRPPGVVPPDDGTQRNDDPQVPDIPPPVDLYGAPTMAQSYEPPDRSRRRRPGARSRDWQGDDPDEGQQPPPPPPTTPPPPPPGRPKGRR